VPTATTNPYPCWLGLVICAAQAHGTEDLHKVLLLEAEVILEFDIREVFCILGRHMSGMLAAR
jgi:hypothetical protein